MNRYKLLGLVLLGFCLAGIGCGDSNKKKVDDNMTSTASPSVDPKTGKAAKTFEAGLVDPNYKK